MNPTDFLQPYTHTDNPHGFLDQAIALAQASELAYGDDAQAITHALGVPLVTVFPASAGSPDAHTQGYWWVNQGVAVMVFRGSDSREDWLANFKLWPPSVPNHDWGKVHPGFGASLASVVKTVLQPFATEAMKSNSIVWLVGHSLGGALAVLAAAWLRIHHNINATVRTFGQPMPGLDDFGAKFDQELPGSLTRFINQQDVVPSMPGVVYEHCGAPKTITAGLVLEQLHGSFAAPLSVLVDVEPAPATEAEFKAFLMRLESAPPNLFSQYQSEGLLGDLIPWLAHHRIGAYIHMLDAIRKTLD